MPQIKPATQADARQIADIARPIWEEHYTPIIGKAQVEYMLEKFQSEQAVSQQIKQGFSYSIVEVESELAGYLSTEKRNSTLFLSKFYLSSKFRGKGIAKQMLRFVIDQAKSLDCKIIELTVNKFNPAYQVYLKLGFKNIDSIQIDIGEGYIMDDYRMQLRIT